MELRNGKKIFMDEKFQKRFGFTMKEYRKHQLENEEAYKIKQQNKENYWKKLEIFNCWKEETRISNERLKSRHQQILEMLDRKLAEVEEEEYFVRINGTMYKCVNKEDWLETIQLVNAEGNFIREDPRVDFFKGRKM